MDAGATGDTAGVAGGVHSGGAAAAGAAGSGTWVEAWDGARAAWAGAGTLGMVADGGGGGGGGDGRGARERRVLPVGARAAVGEGLIDVRFFPGGAVQPAGRAGHP